MKLSTSECRLFYKLHPALMCYVNQRLGTLPEQPGDPGEFYALEAVQRAEVRNALHAQPDLIDEFVASNPFGFDSDEMAVVRSWKHALVGSFYILRRLKHYTVFLSSEGEPKAYGVLALADPFEVLIGRYLPKFIQTVLLPFRGKIVYDGLLSGYNLTFGGGMRRMLDDSYRRAKADFGIITSLPFGSEVEEPEPAVRRFPAKVGTSGARDASTFSLRLTEAQRRTVAGLLPHLEPRLLLDQANQRTLRFSLGEIKEIAQAARAAVPGTSCGMKRNSLRHVVWAAEEAVAKYAEGKIGRIPASERLYQFKITLEDIQLPIWRRIQVKDCTLDELHEHIQTAMGWTNSHLQQFKIAGRVFGDPELISEGFEDDSEVVSSLESRLSSVVPEDGKRFRFEYEYDFGDSWEHEVLFEGCSRAEKGVRYPLCLEGERACPPEDVGGTYGYQEYLEAMADPDHEEHSEYLAWRGPFAPEAFDARATTRRMRRGLPNWREEKWI